MGADYLVGEVKFQDVNGLSKMMVFFHPENIQLSLKIIRSRNTFSRIIVNCHNFDKDLVKFIRFLESLLDRRSNEYTLPQQPYEEDYVHYYKLSFSKEQDRIDFTLNNTLQHFDVSFPVKEVHLFVKMILPKLDDLLRDLRE
jgi:hypothetical protein